MTESADGAALLGLATASPDHVVRQDRALRFLLDRTEDASARRLARRVFPRAAVDTRRSCLPDFTDGSACELFRSGHDPTTAERMKAYRRHVVPLATRAAHAALRDADLTPDAVTHLVFVSCTGFYAPGPDVDLVSALGLPLETRRTLVGFMGCYAAFNGLRVATDHVRADPDARVLLVCAELCSLHFTADPKPGSLVAQALFGDGAAACVLGAANAPVRAYLGDERSSLDPEGAGAMGWEIGDHGFRMHLAPSVPRRLEERLGGFLAEAPDVEHWCVHPGGRAILDGVERALALESRATASARAALREVGNVSSASVLLVLERELARMQPGAAGRMLGFGPGLTLEARDFRRGRRR